MSRNALFIFRRDFRIKDNKGLNFAILTYDNITPIFIFTPEQIGKQNDYRSNNAIQFMIESLKDLDTRLKEVGSKLHIFKGENISVIKYLINEWGITDIVFNQDYTPYARERDRGIETLAKKSSINVHMIEDYLLAPIGSYLKSGNDKQPYTIYTPFKNYIFNTIKNGSEIDKPKTISSNIMKNKLISRKSAIEKDYITYTINDKIIYRGGRKEGKKNFDKIKKLKDYNDTRNTASINTSLLSAYIKFGCFSIREVYWEIKNKLGLENQLLSQLIWREFYFYIAYYFPHVLQGKNYNPKYDKIKWKTSVSNFIKWCNGETGYPIVDAGMKELNTTGYMHNRLRLITANFMNRILGYDWRLGEKYYATQLIDYDPSVNNGNWQWIASTGVDPKPYFQRLFNPWLQSKKSDPSAEYIKKWLPQLKDIPSQHLHEWDKYYTQYNLNDIKYIKPIVDYENGRIDSINMYRKVL
jgi:deoxyribodipyrimidine photo-lyase